MSQSMTVSRARAVSGSADEIWALIRSGGRVEEILPGVITSCRLEGTGEGARRFCGVQGGEIAETLLTVDDDARVFRYRIDSQPLMPVADYVGTLHVVGIGPDRAHVLWTVSFTLLDADAADEVTASLQGLLAGGIDGLAGAIA